MEAEEKTDAPESISIYKEAGLDEDGTVLTAEQIAEKEQAEAKPPKVNSKDKSEGGGESMVPEIPEDSILAGYKNFLGDEANEDFEIPEEVITGDQTAQFNFIKDHITKSIPEVNDEFVQAYQIAKKAGIPPDEFVSLFNKDVDDPNLSSRDYLVKHYLKNNGKSDDNPDGWTREEIEAEVDSMTKFKQDLEAKQARSEAAKAKEASNTKIIDSLKTKYQAKVEKANKKVEADVPKLFESMKDLTEIGGIPHTEEDQNEFLPIFTELIKFNPETGKPRVNDYFHNDQTLYKALWLLHKAEKEGEGSIKTYLSTFKEDYKESILKDKTKIKPSKQAGNTKVSKLPTFDDYV